MSEPASKIAKTQDGGVADQKYAAEEDEQPYADLEKTQLALNDIGKEFASAIVQLEKQFNERKLPFYEQRRTCIRNIPKFWLEVLNAHDVTAAAIRGDDDQVLGHLIGVDVQEKENDGFAIVFTFQEQPYFSNETLTKHLCDSDSASARPEADTIQWHEGMNYNAAVSASAAAEGVATSKKRPREDDGESGSFFDWFSHIGDDDDSVGEAIKEIWIDPMQYYHGSWQANTGGEMDAGDGNELAEEDITGDDMIAEDDAEAEAAEALPADGIDEDEDPDAVMAEMEDDAADDVDGDDIDGHDDGDDGDEDSGGGTAGADADPVVDAVLEDEVGTAGVDAVLEDEAGTAGADAALEDEAGTAGADAVLEDVAGAQAVVGDEMGTAGADAVLEDEPVTTEGSADSTADAALEDDDSAKGEDTDPTAEAQEEDGLVDDKEPVDDNNDDDDDAALDDLLEDANAAEGSLEA